MRMTWSHLLFAHWQVEPKLVSKLLPRGIQIDTREGSAWIGIVPFLMSDVAPRACPAIPGLSRFPELNVRTYVTAENKPGVWFFSLEATSRFAVRAARFLFHLPYMDAQMSVSRTNPPKVYYRSVRTHRNEPAARFSASYTPEVEIFEAEMGTLEHWLTARYCLYSADRRGRIYRGEIDHPRWQLSRAQWQVEENTMTKPLGFELSGDPNLLFAQPIRVNAWKIQRIAQ